MFFVVSTGRSGSKAIAATLSELAGCVCLHEPAPELIRESSGYRYGKVSHDEVAGLLRRTRRPAVDGSVYCESNQTLSLLIPVAAEVFPEARFVWLVRNGLDMVASAYQKQWYSGHSENHDRYEDCPPLEQAWIDGRIRGDLCGDMTAEEWVAMDRFSRCCWYWRYVNGIIEADLGRLDEGRHFFLRLEDFPRQISLMANWMGLDSGALPQVRWTNVAKGIPHHWTQWTEEQMESFTGRCGDLMDRLYPSWRAFTGAEGDVFVAPVIRAFQEKAKEVSEELERMRDHSARQIEKIGELHDEKRRLISENQGLAGENRRLKAHLESLLASKSWKLTAPLRKVEESLRRFRDGAGEK